MHGVTPHIVLPAVANILEDVGEAGLENPLDWDTIESAQFEPVNQVASYLPELRRLSDARVASSKDFDYVREDMDRIREMQKRKTILLNELERAKELQEARDRDEARKAEREARPTNGQVVYELSLKDVPMPGLPQPVGSHKSTAAANPETPSDDARLADPPDPEAQADAPIDPTLDETGRILLDYISLLEKSNVLTAGKKNS